MEERPLISVVIPLYNKEATVARTIDTVRRQSYDRWELIIVDDGSTDNGAVIAERYADDRIRVFRKTNGGVSVARNYGARQAKGEFVMFLDADDRLMENALQVLWRLVAVYKVRVAVANYLMERQGRPDITSYYPWEGRITNLFRACYLQDMWPRPGACMVHIDVFLRHPFDEGLCRYEDAEWPVRAFRGESIAYSPMPIMTYCLDSAELSGRIDHFEKDYISCMPVHADSFWEGMFYGYMLREGLYFYGHRTEWLSEHYADYFKYIRWGRWLRCVFRWRRSVNKRVFRYRYGKPNF